VRAPLQAPIRQIAENGRRRRLDRGRQGAREQVRHLGFNAQTEEYVDLIAAGIIDPAKVVAPPAGRGLGRRPDDHHPGGHRRSAEEERRRRGMPGGGGMGGMGDMDF